MREIQGVFKSFINGSRHNLMIVSCAPENSALLLKSLDAIEDDPAVPDIFLAFGHPFGIAESYVSQTLASVREQFNKVNDELVRRGDSALAPFPMEVEDVSHQPETRLFIAIQHIRNVIPKGQQVIWIFYPLEISAPTQYLHLIDYIRLQIEDTPLRGTKMIVREGPSHVLVRQLKNEPKVRIYWPALDPNSLMKKLDKQANDPKVPPEEQAQIHMMLAGMDIANKRFDQALARNQELLGYFYHTGQKHHQSIVLNNIGDIHYMQSRYPDAQESYEKAVLVAVEEKSQPLVIYQSINLGNALLMQQKLDEALTYYQSAEQLAQASSVPTYQIQALEQIGVVKHQSKQLNEAAEAWEEAVNLCQRFHHEAGVRTNLERLQDLYKEMGDSERLNKCRKALTLQQSGNQ